MATEQHFSVRKGRTCTITVDVVGVSNWTGITSKLFAAYDMGESTPEIVLVGTIDTGQNKISFDFLKDTTEDLEVQTSLRYEVAIFKADGSYIKDTNYGLINIGPVVKDHPNT